MSESSPPAGPDEKRNQGRKGGRGGRGLHLQASFLLSARKPENLKSRALAGIGYELAVAVVRIKQTNPPSILFFTLLQKAYTDLLLLFGELQQGSGRRFIEGPIRYGLFQSLEVQGLTFTLLWAYRKDKSKKAKGKRTGKERDVYWMQCCWPL